MDPRDVPPSPILLDYQRPLKRRRARPAEAPLIMRITDPPRGSCDTTRSRGFAFAFITLVLLVLVACAVHFVIDYARLLDTMSR